MVKPVLRKASGPEGFVEGGAEGGDGIVQLRECVDSLCFASLFGLDDGAHGGDVAGGAGVVELLHDLHGESSPCADRRGGLHDGGRGRLRPALTTAAAARERRRRWRRSRRRDEG